MGDAMPERWLPVVGWEGLYEVSDWARVRSLPRRYCTGRILKGAPVKGGYLTVHLHDAAGGRHRTFYVHHLVMLAFVGPCPEGQEIRHLDGDAANSVLTNLVYGSHPENINDAVGHGTHFNAGKTHCPKRHKYTPENTYNKPSGGRVCKTCMRQFRRDYKIRKRNAQAKMTSTTLQVNIQSQRSMR